MTANRHAVRRYATRERPASYATTSAGHLGPHRLASLGRRPPPRVAELGDETQPEPARHAVSDPHPGRSRTAVCHLHTETAVMAPHHQGRCRSGMDNSVGDQLREHHQDVSMTQLGASQFVEPLGHHSAGQPRRFQGLLQLYAQSVHQLSDLSIREDPQPSPDVIHLDQMSLTSTCVPANCVTNPRNSRKSVRRPQTSIEVDVSITAAATTPRRSAVADLGGA